MANYADSEDKLISEFNEAAFQISRLHNIWLECKNLREKGNLISWKWKLDTAAIELWNDAKRLDEPTEKDENKLIEKLKKLDEEISKAETDKKFAEFYKKLIEKEKLLRQIQEESGKGGKLRSADDDYM